jgi:hypothetical protein
MKLLSLLVSIFLLHTSCTAQTGVRTVKLGTGSKVVLLLDSTAAAAAITYDRRDVYFDLINVSEMSIQMKQPVDASGNRDKILPAYISYLKHDVSNFEGSESDFTASVMEKVYKTCTEVNPDMFPDTIKIIKTKGTHYGDGVYYTRENCIIVPANELQSAKTNPFLTTMFHETFHVYSRLNPAKRVQLYHLIGFNPVGLTKLNMPATLRERILYNPDGVDFAQKIDLNLGDTLHISAIPVIYSTNIGFKPGQKEFFSYLGFNLYQITPEKDGKWKVVVKDDGYSSTLNLDKIPDYFRQIKDNTGYIIHPDEVLADNFSFIMMEKNGNKISQKFSPEGKKLLIDIEDILKIR